MTYTSEKFQTDLGELQNTLAKIKELEEEKKNLEAHIILEKGDKLQYTKKMIDNIDTRIRYLKIIYKYRGISICQRTPIMALKIEEDKFMRKSAINNPNLKKGIKTISLYASLEFNSIFAGPKKLPTTGECTLMEFDQHQQNTNALPNDIEATYISLQAQNPEYVIKK